MVVAVVGVASAETPPGDDLRRNDSLFSRLEPATTGGDVPLDSPRLSSSANGPLTRDEEDDTRVSHDRGLRSTVKVLKSILKKPRRWSVEVESARADKDDVDRGPDVPSVDSANNTADETISSLSFERNPDAVCTAQNPGVAAPQPLATSQESSLPSQPLPRSSLQMGPFDRKLFAMRGAELRHEYMRDSPASDRNSFS
jgi:hypothetical protein